MKKLLALLALCPALAFATSTTTSTNGGKYVTVVFTTGTESAPTNEDTVGIRLDGLKGVVVMVETGSAMTAGGLFLAYIRNPVSGYWERVADGSLDLTVSAVTKQGWPGLFIPVDDGRITWVPSGIGVAGTLYLVGAVK